MKFSYNWIKDLIREGQTSKKSANTSRPPQAAEVEQLANLLTMHSFEVEGVERVKDDFVLDIDILPNRAPDCLSHLGIAREVVALLKSREKKASLKKLNLKFKKQEIKTKDLVEVEVKNEEDCSRYTAKVIDKVKVKESPKLIQQRLKLCGLKPINNIVDIANYVMLETGQPLHAFDFEKIENKKIVVRRAKKGEKIRTLDNEDYELNNKMVVIADSEKPLAIAGIKGGKKAAVSKNTKRVILEAANFNPRIVRSTSRALKLKTDASWRFENSLDPNLTELGIKRATALIAKEANGKPGLGLSDFYPKPRKPVTIELNLDYLRKLLGLEISNEKAIEILENLSFKVKKNNARLKVKIPTFRLDISLEEDLIEEVGRVHGFEKIPSSFPEVALIPPERNENVFWRNQIKKIMKELKFSEAYNYSFISEKQKHDFNFEDLVELKNPISKNHKYLRPSLIPNLLENVSYNFDVLESFAKGKNEIRIFEIGKVFRESEKEMVSGLLAQKEGEDREVFYRLKGVLDAFLNKLGLSEIWYDSVEATPEDSWLRFWESKQKAEIKVGQEEIGFLGVISNSLLKKLGIGASIVGFDLDFEILKKLSSEEQEYKPLSRYPSVVRDLAVLVPIEVKVESVLNQINIAGGPLIRDIDLFDIYTGEEIPAGKKNLAFHIIYQSQEKTLKSEQVDKIQERIIKELEKNQYWEVRK